MKKFSIQSLRVGIDPGTFYTRVYEDGRELELSEPSVAALDYVTGDILAVGTEAAILLRSKAGQLRECRPFEAGEVRHYEAARLLLQTLLEKVQQRAVMRPEVCLAVPRSISSVQKRAWADVAQAAGAKDTVLVDRAAAAALGSQIDIARPQAVLAADIGAGIAVSVMASGGYISSAYSPAGGEAVAKAIEKYVRDTYGVFGDSHAVATLQRDAAVAVQSVGERSVTLEGRLYSNGTAAVYTVTSRLLYPVLQPALRGMASLVEKVLRQCPPQAQSDIWRGGFQLTGGGSLLAGLDLFLTSQLGIPVLRADEPFGRVAVGAALALQRRKEWPYLLEAAADPYGRSN